MPCFVFVITSATGSAISIASILPLNISFIKHPVIALFTGDPEIASLISSLSLWSIPVETGRSASLITIAALKGAGDIRYPVLQDVISMRRVQTRAVIRSP